MCSQRPREPSPPAADIVIDVDSVRRSCERLVPGRGVDLDAVRWEFGGRPLGEGWDNVMWPVGELGERPLVLRIARRSSVRALLRREGEVLRLLAAGPVPLPLAIPVPLATTDDAVLMPWVDGPTAAEVDAEARRRIAHHLARMLAAVHSTPALDIDRNPVRGVPLATRADAFDRDLDRAVLSAGMRELALSWWNRGTAATVWAHTDLLLHGDPHPGNVVVPVSAATHPAVLIDWGDTTAGDPASDLGGLLLHHPAKAVLESYRLHATWMRGAANDTWAALIDRAWAWGARLALSLLTAYGPAHPLGQVGRRFFTL